MIGFVGAIGSGKSTLSGILSNELGVNRIQENFPDNPFLENFYTDPQEYSFRSQVWFLRSTIDQMLSEKSDKSRVLDPANEMNLLFAKTHLDLGWMNVHEFGLYTELYEILNAKAGIKKPDLFIWTDAPEDTLAKRIIERGRPYELKILSDYPHYLTALKDSIKWAARTGTLGNVIYVNTATSNFRDPVQVQGLLNSIGRRIG